MFLWLTTSCAIVLVLNNLICQCACPQQPHLSSFSYLAASDVTPFTYVPTVLCTKIYTWTLIIICISPNICRIWYCCCLLLIYRKSVIFPKNLESGDLHTGRAPCTRTVCCTSEESWLHGPCTNHTDRVRQLWKPDQKEKPTLVWKPSGKYFKGTNLREREQLGYFSTILYSVLGD